MPCTGRSANRLRVYGSVLRALPIVFVMGCGPIRAGSTLVDAAAEVNAAQTAGAKKHAPYEYTAAEAYLHKAREDHSYAKFETAILFAGKSVDCARLARAIADSEARSEMGAERSAVPEGTRCRAGTSDGPGARESAEGSGRTTPIDEPDDPRPLRQQPPPPKPPVVKEAPLPEGDAER